jgi:hypothetical protein
MQNPGAGFKQMGLLEYVEDFLQSKRLAGSRRRLAVEDSNVRSSLLFSVFTQ